MLVLSKSDDFVEPDMFDMMYVAAKKTRLILSDLIFGNCWCWLEKVIRSFCLVE